MYRAVGDLCAIDFSTLVLPVDDGEAKFILDGLGFQQTQLSISQIALSVIGSSYRTGAGLSEAPRYFNCSGLTKWLYGQLGIWIPRWCIQQYSFGLPIDPNELRPGDLLFLSGFTPLPLDDPKGVSHVAMVLDEGTVIHAANRKMGVGVFKSPTAAITKADDFRGARRIVHNWDTLTIYRVPAEREIESSDDIRWLICQNAP